MKRQVERSPDRGKAAHAFGARRGRVAAAFGVKISAK